MITKQLILRTLDALLAAPGDPEAVAETLGRSVDEVHRAVQHLDQRGLARREDARLTMGGFAIAVALRSNASPTSSQRSAENMAPPRAA